jgi:hypothetical protein
MKCKNEFEFIVLALNDYMNTLPVATKIALGEKLQYCANSIEAVLNEPEVASEVVAEG